MIEAHIAEPELRVGARVRFTFPSAAQKMAIGQAFALLFPDGRRAEATFRTIGDDLITFQVTGDSQWDIARADIQAADAESPVPYSEDWVVRGRR